MNKRKRKDMTTTTIAAAPELEIPGASISIEVPLAEDDGLGYRRRHIDMHLLPGEAIVIAKILAGLRRDGKRLPNDYPAESLPDVIRWLIAEISKNSAAIR
jgi:hypothetical protein